MPKLTEVITVEKVKDAYAKSALEPLAGEYFLRQQGNQAACACPIGAILYAETDQAERSDLVTKLNSFGGDVIAANLLGCDLAEVSYFVNGVDGEEPPFRQDRFFVRVPEDSWMDAYDLGRMVREELGL